MQLDKHYLKKVILHFHLVPEGLSICCFSVFQFALQFVAFLCFGGKPLAQNRNSVLAMVSVIAACRRCGLCLGLLGLLGLAV